MVFALGVHGSVLLWFVLSLCYECFARIRVLMLIVRLFIWPGVLCCIVILNDSLVLLVLWYYFMRVFDYDRFICAGVFVFVLGNSSRGLWILGYVWVFIFLWGVCLW